MWKWYRKLLARVRTWQAEREAMWQTRREIDQMFRTWEDRFVNQSFDPEQAKAEALALQERLGIPYSRADHCRMWDFGLETSADDFPYPEGAFGEVDEVR